jgi:hypothetical protein
MNLKNHSYGHASTTDGLGTLLSRVREKSRAEAGYQERRCRNPGW